ncbi:MAG TPA: P-II family nitrogen regulator, partial [Acidilobales archaeon]|nr:P-II family nitrogen regulator [Acidilobales archaeon]
MEAPIREETLNKVKEELSKAGFISLTVYSVRGRGEAGRYQV